MLGACGCRLCPCPLARAWPVARIPAASRARRIPKRRPFRRRRTARRACQHHGTACPPLGCRRGPRFQSEPTCRQCSGTPETACAPASRARDRNRSLAWARNPSPCTTSPPTISRAKSRLGNRAPRLNFPRCHQLIHRKPPPRKQLLRRHLCFSVRQQTRNYMERAGSDEGHGDLRPHGGSDVGREDLQPGGASGRPANHCPAAVRAARWRARTQAARQGPGFCRDGASWQVEEEINAQRVRLCRAWQRDWWQCLGDAIPVPIDMLSMAIDTPGSPDEEHAAPLFDSVLGRRSRTDGTQMCIANRNLQEHDFDPVQVTRARGAAPWASPLDKRIAPGAQARPTEAPTRG